MNFRIKKHLLKLKNNLLCKARKIEFKSLISRKTKFPKQAGVYALFENKKLVYVGETGSIKGRMRDILDTRHHTVRRKIGEFNFSNISGFSKASSKKQYPPKTEKRIDKWLENKIKLSFLVVDFGRKELEEFIIKDLSPKFNSKGQRE